MNHLNNLLRPTLLLLTLTGMSALANNYNVVASNDRDIGAYGGLYTTLGAKGEAENAIVVISRSGYLLPLTSTGNAALFGSAWFAGEGCSGDEYLSPAATDTAAAPVSGMVYRSLASGLLRYIPQYTVPESIVIQSRMYFDNGKLKCAAQKQNLLLLPTLENNSEITAFRSSDTGQAIALRPIGKSAGTLPFSNVEENTVEEPTPFEQQECSPGCTMGDLGNQVCDIACYVNACDFDRGDCDNERPEFLQEELGKFCSPGCTVDDLGDGFCDTACNNSACEFDRGDCAAE